MSENIKTGLTHSIDIVVKEEHSAMAIGSGYLPVYSTPYMIAGMERAAAQCVIDMLDSGCTTVGTLVNISHTAPTPIGATVTTTAKLIEIDKKRLTFEVESTYQKTTIGKGVHERFIVNKEKFMSKL